MRHRKIASGWRTVGRLNRQNRRLHVRLGKPGEAPKAAAQDMALIRNRASNVPGQRQMNWHTIANVCRDSMRAQAARTIMPTWSAEHTVKVEGFACDDMFEVTPR